jgi:hypothetical protein
VRNFRHVVFGMGREEIGGVPELLPGTFPCLESLPQASGLATGDAAWAKVDTILLRTVARASEKVACVFVDQAAWRIGVWPFRMSGFCDAVSLNFRHLFRAIPVLTTQDGRSPPKEKLRQCVLELFRPPKIAQVGTVV